jgi:adenylate cyclase
MFWLFKAIIFGFLIGLLGLSISLTHFGHNLEENLGLDLLFKLRGVRQAPPEVIVVSIDKLSADKLNLPNDPSKWPRSLHARLIENLSSKGVPVIAFDLLFSEARLAEDDNEFASAIRQSGNVILTEYLIRKTPVDASGNKIENVYVEKHVPPIPLFAQSAFAVACFPLPKVPLKVSQYWTFKRSAGDTPTLPVVIFQSYASEVYDEFIRLLKKHIPDKIDNLPANKELLVNSKEIKKVITELKDIFVSQPIIAKRMLEDLRNSKTLLVSSRQKQLLKSLIKMYQNPNNHYLNFYGPPRTVTTIPYYQALQLTEEIYPNQTQLNLNPKAVFIGLSENIQSGKKNDGYHTVFSQPNGVDISGVEIAATAFANLLEDMPVQQLNIREHLVTVFILGLMMGIFCRPFPVIVSALSSFGIGIIYLIAVLYQFGTNGIWYPLIVPLLFQLPIALCGGLLSKYIESNKERRNIKKAFQYYLPGDMVDKISKSFKDITTGSQTVYGTFLSTDAEDYTTLSESMDPKQLSGFLNKYYECVFEPVKRRNGIVANIIGDSMLAMWVMSYSDVDLNKKACLAALDITRAVNRFNRSNDLQLPTRVGLHSGHILLGNIGAIDHYEYRPVGDIVNTVTRIEGLNKYLNTEIVISGDMLNQLDGFLTRELGKFLLAGKLKPIMIHELICPMDDANNQQRNLCLLFSEALAEFRKQSWEEASRILKDLINMFGQDGPSQFYLTLCEQYGQKPPERSWNEIICMGNK